MIKTRMMKRERNVSATGANMNAYRVWQEIQRKKDH
jgi:hypothetical protein